MNRRLVSVLTPTYKRHTLLMEMIENVYAQSYRPLEIIIVADGPDPELMEKIGSLQPPDGVRVFAHDLGRNWSSFLPDSFVAAPINVATFFGHGDLNLWLADDERMTPDHISSLVDALESSGADFAYSKVELQWAYGRREVIGTDPPREGQITNVLYRTDLLKRGLYPFGAGMTSDWACIRQWLDAGAVWAFVDRVTLTHRVDH